MDDDDEQEYKGQIDNDKEETKKEKKKGLPPGLKSVYLSVFIDVSGIGIIIPVLPYLILSFDGAGATEVGLTLTVYSLAQVLGAAGMGYLSDKKGRRPVLLISLAASSISFLACGFARSLAAVVATRAISGLAGGSIPVAQAYISDVTTIEERPKYLGLIGASIGIGFTFGPALGAATAAILEAAGCNQRDQYSGVFFFASLVGATAFIYAYRNLPEAQRIATNVTQPHNGSKGPVKGRSGETGEANESDSDVGVGKQVTKGPVTKTDWRAACMVGGVMFALNYAFTVMQSTYGVLLEDEWGYSTTVLGVVLFCSGIEIAILQAKIIKPLCERLGKHMSSVLAAALLGVGLALLPVTALQAPAGQVLHFFIFAVHVAGFSISQTSLPALQTKFATPEEQGRVLGLGQSFQAAARCLSPIVSGALYDKERFLPYLVGGLTSFASIALLLVLFRTSLRRRRGSSHSNDGDVGGLDAKTISSGEGASGHSGRSTVAT